MRVATIAALWLAVAGIAVYWVTFFATVSDAEWDPCYVAFERAFPPADAALALSAVCAAVAWQRRQASAAAWSLFAAGQFCFLGLLGVTYLLQHRAHDLTPGVVAELGVNIFCLGLAAWLAAVSWRRPDLAAA